MVEKWLIQVEEVMINSLKKVTEDAVNAYYQTPRGKWVQEWPGQVRTSTTSAAWGGVIPYCARCRKNALLIQNGVKIVWNSRSTNEWILGRVSGIRRRFCRGG